MKIEWEEYDRGFEFILPGYYTSDHKASCYENFPFLLNDSVLRYVRSYVLVMLYSDFSHRYWKWLGAGRRTVEK